ncbi:Uncharacterised protein [Vibrio cholerae]|nr:Uncharacterised protein [Vibrio cholerae]
MPTIAESSITISLGLRPLRSTCLLTRWSLAILSFSSSVYPDKRITSIRSSNGPGMFIEFEVATNITSDRS